MIIFRVDGNKDIGLGHVMRCKAIADEAKRMGQTCRFIISSRDCEDLIAESGYSVDIIGSNYLCMEPGDFFRYMEEYNPSVAFIDSYFVTMEYMKAAHDFCNRRSCKLVYIDDRCEEPNDCDVLLNYNIFAKADAYKRLYEGKEEPKFLLGTDYVPLRREFQNRDIKGLSKKGSKIFVSTGGSDIGHLAEKMVKLAGTKSNYEFHFLVGAVNPNKEAIKCAAQDFNNVIIHENVKRVDELMRECDVAISAAGSTLYELCAMQIPTLTYVLADNQIPAAQEFEAKGIMKNCGDIRELGSEGLAKILINDAISLINNYREQSRAIEVMGHIVDGSGAGRIFSAII